MAFPQYGRLGQIPTDIHYSIVYNAPPDTLDDLCQNEVFSKWCHDPRFLAEYCSRLNPDL